MERASNSITVDYFKDKGRCDFIERLR